ncbi:MAG TPA: hypothetical protein DCL01_01415 [Thauera sp.]|nr:hypothetical protein [Thauera sp.]HHW65777.1 hypothetical protein [Rhodocyclaceae bacterium]
MRNTASGTRALAPTTPTLTPELLAALKAIDACAAGLSHYADFDQADRAEEIRVLLEGVKSYADEALAELDERRGTRTNHPTSYTPGPYFVFDGGFITSRAPDHHYVAQVCHDRTGQRHLGNEALLVAAPDLHQALKAIIADNSMGLGLVRPRTMKLVRAAVAKVEGGAA